MNDIENIRSMANNLKVAGAKKRKAKEAVFYLCRMKEETGRSFQSLLSDIVVSYVRTEAKTDSRKNAMVKDFSESLANG